MTNVQRLSAEASDLRPALKRSPISLTQEIISPLPPQQLTWLLYWTRSGDNTSKDQKFQRIRDSSDWMSEL